jgi:ABC-type polar amino acid transport system ATPase subunit
MIKLEHISKSWPNKTGASIKVIDNLNLSVKLGQVLVLLGQSGSGKSTLLKCMNLLEQPSSGVLCVNSEKFDFNQKIKVPVKKLQKLRQSMGMVFQQFNLWPHLTVLENLTLAPSKIFKKTKTKTDIKLEAQKLLEQFGLLEKQHDYPATLSGGQQQRVSIARSLMMQPKIMLFDEPTSALDPEMVNEVLKTIQNLKSLGMTMIISTHEIGFAKRIADKVCFLADGKIHESGSSEIITKPKTQKFKQFLQIMEH